MLWKNLSLAFTAGCLGGLVNSIAVWLFGALGINQALGVSLAPHFTPAWLYPRLVWGGLWGLLFLLPLKGLTYTARGLLLSLGPTLGQLLVVFPLKAQQGLFGLQLGYLTPLLVLFFNAVWGIVAAYWLKLTRES
ncbi:MAG: hypothetical protein QME75_11350 [Deltaproteobacteria bacterium]|nr:hypothetical protein [Deltaproteobacteria bacterium]